MDWRWTYHISSNKRRVSIKAGGGGGGGGVALLKACVTNII